ncbi:carbohydrate-binding module family 1 protein [Karstenula rhodostoma CBS 690.94]|uniref:Carbohydrate-binding module family 1 protein n=1 Tax=Karstenula rhodostoma CBS 690.94 TaxID=1392251 RepID=A0A9P4UEG0_9PLEO|nr:carbohydrate-binding module family 1 protein [Karstenula rhodostoma CBS 690.94]
MLFQKIALSALSAGCLAAQANNLAPRQSDGSIIFTTICLGPRCSDAPEPTSPPKTTLKTTTTTTTTKKTTSSMKTPTKTSSPSYPTKTQTEEVGPSSTRCPVPLYYQCGGYYDGKPWTGCEKCVKGAKCVWQNDFYYQCIAEE